MHVKSSVKYWIETMNKKETIYIYIEMAQKTQTVEDRLTDRQTDKVPSQT